MSSYNSYKFNKTLSTLSEENVDKILLAIIKGKEKVFEGYTSDIEDLVKNYSIQSSYWIEDVFKKVFAKFAPDEKVVIDCVTEEGKNCRIFYYKGKKATIYPELIYKDSDEDLEKLWE